MVGHLGELHSETHYSDHIEHHSDPQRGGGWLCSDVQNHTLCLHAELHTSEHKAPSKVCPRMVQHSVLSEKVAILYLISWFSWQAHRQSYFFNNERCKGAGQNFNGLKLIGRWKSSIPSDGQEGEWGGGGAVPMSWHLGKGDLAPLLLMSINRLI